MEAKIIAKYELRRFKGQYKLNMNYNFYVFIKMTGILICCFS